LHSSATLPASTTPPERLLGSTTPRIFTPPLIAGRPGPCGCGCALTPKTSLGFSCADFAEEVLGFELIPWQRWLLIHALELRPDGRFRFRTVLVLVARQNGKTTLVEVKNLWKMFVLRVPLVIGTAQNLDVSEESWDKAVEIVESIPELFAEVPRDGGVVRVNGKKSLKLIHGSRWKVAAASRKGGRGLSGDDVNLDELREHHTWDSWAAVTKTTMARRKAQIWAFSNAGDDRSIVLNDLQEKGRATVEDPSADSSLGIFEWSAPDDCPIDDPNMWRLANPSLGYPQGISYEALRRPWRRTRSRSSARSACVSGCRTWCRARFR
jgi:phage terminase large subunit-like protein